MVTVVFIILFLASAFLGFSVNSSSATTANPTKLAIFAVTPSVLADNSTYKCIFVQLQDASGKPARAANDITVGLSSSLTYVGTVDSSVIIPKGETFASANFASTFNPGTTTISASATSYATVMTSISSVGPIPSALGVYGCPSTLPADGNSYAAIMVQLQDSSGSPALAPQGGAQVALSSSNTAVGTVTSAVTIPEGQTYAVANFNPTTLAQTEGKVETSIVTAVSQGLTTSQVTITTTPLASNPTQLKIFLGPSKVPADKNSYSQIAVQLQSASGYVAKTLSDISVNLASSDSSVCTVNSVNIESGETYALATLSTTYKAGSATITAVANNFPLTSQAVTTVGFTPTKLVVYCVPTSLPSDGKTYQTVEVQLQDSLGRPAKAIDADISVKLFSSQPTVGVVDSTLTIPFGRTQAMGNLITTYTAGTTQITAQASGYTTGQATLTTYLVDYYTIQASAGPNGTISPSGNISVNLGSNQNFAFTTTTGYRLADITVDGVSQGANSPFTLYNVTGPHTVFARFANSTYTLAVTQTVNGIITPGTSIVNYGDTPIFTITPNTGYHIANITANGASVAVNSSTSQTYQFSPVSANGSLTASYAINKYAIQVTQTANGTITPGSTTVNFDDSLTFTITPKTGFQVADVLVNGTSAGAVNSYTATKIHGATTISATFTPDNATAATSSTDTASPTPSPTPTPSTQPTDSPSASPSATDTVSSTSSGAFPTEARYLAAILVVAASSATGLIVWKKTRNSEFFS